MAATTVDINTPQREGKLASYPVAASTKIYLGSLLALDASGYLVSATDSAAQKFAGIAAEGVDNSAGAAAALNCKVHRVGVHEVTSSGLALTDVGKPMYVTDNATVQLAVANMFCGIIEQYKSATKALLDITPATKNPGTGKLFEFSAFWPSTVGASEVTVKGAVEFPRPFRVLYGFAEAKTAPDTAKNTTVKITDGTTAKTFTIAATTTHGEDKTIDQVYAAGANMSITLQDDASSALTADVNITFICEEL